MNPKKRFAQDSLWLLTARIGMQGSMVVITYLLARRLGTGGFGEYAFIATVIAIGNVLTTFGSDMILIREIAAKDDFSSVPSILTLQLFASFILIGLVFLFAPLLPNQTSESILALRVYSFVLIPLAFFTLFTSMLRGAQRMTSYARLNLGAAFIQVIAIAMLVHHGTSIAHLAYVLLGVQIAGTVFAGLLSLPLFPKVRAWYFSKNELFSLLIICLPVALIAILGILYQRVSLAILSFLGTSTMVGLFSAAARVVEATRIGHIAVFTALYPAMANANPDNRRVFRSSLPLLLAVSAVGSMLIVLFAENIVDIFFGMEYRPSISILKILSFTLIPYTINSYFSLMFLAMKQEKIVLPVLVVSLLLLIILNIWFIPYFGQNGASWAIIISESFQAALYLLLWIINPVLQSDITPSKGASYELSDLS